MLNRFEIQSKIQNENVITKDAIRIYTRQTGSIIKKAAVHQLTNNGPEIYKWFF